MSHVFPNWDRQPERVYTKRAKRTLCSFNLFNLKHFKRTVSELWTVRVLGDGITGYPVPNLLHFVMPDLGGILGLVSWKDEHPNRRKNAHHYNLHADKAVLGTVYRSTQQYERVSNFESGKNGVVNKAKPEEAHLTRDITELRVKTEYGDRTRALSYGNAALAQAER